MNLKKRAVGGVPTRAEVLDNLLEQYRDLDAEADQLIEAWVSDQARQCPGVPRDVLRQVELDARSTTYSYRAALERLKCKL